MPQIYLIITINYLLVNPVLLLKEDQILLSKVCARLPNVTVANLHAISSDIADAGDASANVIVAALIDDVA